MLESRRWSILLYAVFLSAFLLAFFASFRTGLTAALSESASKDASVRSVSNLKDAVARMASDFSYAAAPVSGYRFESPNDNGSVHTGAVFGGVPETVPIFFKSSAGDFEVYSASGDAVEFAVFDASGIPVSSVALPPGVSAVIALPASATWSLVIRSLGSRSVFEIDRRGSGFGYPDAYVRTFRSSGKASEYLWNFRINEP